MISIITAVRNQLPMNKIFYEKLVETTTIPYELVVIDNNSNDGTREFFNTVSDSVVENPDNYSYPHCQNQGIEASNSEYLAFFNNDLILTKGWAEHAIRIMTEKDIDVLSFSTNDSLGDKKYQKKVNRRWKRIKYPVLKLFGINIFSLKLALKLTYSNIDNFSSNRFEKFGDETVEGFSGSCIMMKRSALAKVGFWDERIQAGDFDLANRVKERSLIYQDIRPIQLALGIYFHHYQRLTLRHGFVPFVDREKLISIEDKWGDKAEELRKDVVG